MKLLVFRSSQPLLWESCKAISSGLQAAYQKLDKKFEILWHELSPERFESQDARTLEDLAEVARLITEHKPDRLVFMDQKPIPPVILQRLRGFLDYPELPPIVIHIYGDFTYFAGQWFSFLAKAADLKIQFVVASKSQERLLRYFLGDKIHCSICHFPVVDETLFDPQLRQKARGEGGVGEDEGVIIYTGRVHLQKNVDLLLKAFADHCARHTERSWKLWIVGAMDDLSSQSLGLATPEGYIYKKIEKVMASLRPQVQARIQFWGWAGKERLRQLLCGADVFASFSLYHDEDFGMAPAEALVNGLPCVLSDWGGYSGFVDAEGRWACRLLPVSFSDTGFALDMKGFSEALSGQNLETSQRIERGQLFHQRFSAEAAAEILNQVLPTMPLAFGELSWKLSLFVRNVSYDGARQVNEIFFPSKDSYYDEVYSNYISGTVEP